MKKLFLLLVVCSFMPLLANTVSFNFEIAEPQIDGITAFDNSETYDKISIDDCIYLTIPGEPQLPVKPVTLLLPPREKAVNINVHYSNSEILEGDFNIIPNQTPVPMSYQGKISFTTPNQKTYNSNNFYPENLNTELTTQYYKGHSIVVTNIYPVQYNPVTKKIIYYSNLEIEIETEFSSESDASFSRFFRSDSVTNEEIANAVLNYENINLYPQTEQTRDENHQLVIVTGANYVTNFEPLMELKIKQGYNPLIETIENIYNNYSGVDDSEKLRNFLIFCYENYGTDFVLLGGDSEIIPFRGFTLVAGETVDHGLPSDVYFSGLDRVGQGSGPDWDTNDNGEWGEAYEADYYPEIATGRIIASTSQEFDAAINKQIMYQLNPVVNDLENYLMVGEELNNDPYTYGGNYKDQIVQGGNYDGYTTAGLPTNISVDYLYERDGYWSLSQLKNKMNNGINILNHLGHSNTDYNMKFYISDVTNNSLTANGVENNFFVIYTQGCYPAAFDMNCIAEKFTTIDNGCAIFIGNTRYGWYMPGGTNSSSQFLDRHFFNALVGDGITKVALANNDSKIEGISQCTNDPWFRWSFYEVTVFGDPTADLWTAQPLVFNPNYPDAITLDDTEITIATGISNALVGLSLNGEHLISGVTGASGSITLEFEEPFQGLGLIEINISAHNYLTYQGTIDLIAGNAPYIIIEDYEVVTEDDDVIEFGESVSLNITLKNIGSQSASNTSITIEEQNQYITISDNMEEIEELPANTTITIDNAFTFEVSSSIPNSTVFEIIANIVSGTFTGNPQMNFIAFSPVVQTGLLTILDNGNGILDAGETTDISFNVQNNGGTAVENLIIQLSTTDPFIEINQGNNELNILEEGENSDCIFNLTISENVPDSYMAMLYISYEGDGNYSANTEYVVPIGLITEDFETGDFSQYNWEFSGNANWSVVSNQSNGGIYSARSGNISNQQQTEMSISLTILNDSEISFYKKTSCEQDPNNNYDYLKFSIDGTEMGRWDGETAWSQSSYFVSAGEHTFKWNYIKDQAATGGQDCVWVDDIIFPPHVNSVIPQFIIDQSSLDFGQVAIGDSLVKQITIFNMGEIALIGEIYELEGFEITSLSSRRNSKQSSTDNARENLSYSIEPLEFEIIQVKFLPTEEIDYSGEIMISSNDPFHLINIIEVTASAIGVGNCNSTNDFIDANLGNYPNPFNPTTEVKFSVKYNNTSVSMDIYNIKGEHIKSYPSKEFSSGMNSIFWHGKDMNNKEVGSGVYFYKISINGKNSISKMLLLK